MWLRALIVCDDIRLATEVETRREQKTIDHDFSVEQLPRAG